MQAASSAKRTCSESRSTSLCTATVLMPISLQVQMMRHAISPRFAIRIFLNLRGLNAISNPATKKHKRHKLNYRLLCASCALLWLNSKKRLAVFYRLAILDINLDYFTTRLSLNLVHEFHGFDDAHHRLRFDVAADLHKRIRRRRRRTIERADDGRRNDVQILILRRFGGSVCTGMRWSACRRRRWLRGWRWWRQWHFGCLSRRLTVG